jgi:lysophospholipase L1-like esterase
LVPHLTERCRLRIRSLAVGGVKIRHVLEEQLPMAVANPGDVAFVSIGGNDALRAGVGPIMERQLEAVVSGLIEAGHLVVLSGAGDMGTPPRAVHPFQTLLTWRSIMTDRVHDRVAARYPEARKVPMWDTAPEFRSREGIWAPDLFHPNRDGHKIWADVIAPHLAGAIDEVLARRPAVGDAAPH